MGEYKFPLLDSDTLLFTSDAYALQRPQLLGEADLRNMCASVKYENAWLYVPHHNLWMHPTITQFALAEVTTKDIPLQVPHIDYHIHPNEIARESFRSFMSKGEHSEELTKMYSVACQASILTPSLADMTHYLESRTMLEGRIVSKVGTTVITITNHEFDSTQLEYPKADQLFELITSDTRVRQILYEDNFTPFFQDTIAYIADLYKECARISFEPAP